MERKKRREKKIITILCKAHIEFIKHTHKTKNERKTTKKHHQRTNRKMESKFIVFLESFSCFHYGNRCICKLYTLIH